MFPCSVSLLGQLYLQDSHSVQPLHLLFHEQRIPTRHRASYAQVCSILTICFNHLAKFFFLRYIGYILDFIRGVFIQEVGKFRSHVRSQPNWHFLSFEVGIFLPWYCSVLSNWEFFIKMRAYYLQPSSLQYSSFLKEGESKAGSSHFNDKFSF